MIAIGPHSVSVYRAPSMQMLRSRLGNGAADGDAMAPNGADGVAFAIVANGADDLHAKRLRAQSMLEGGGPSGAIDDDREGLYFEPRPLGAHSVAFVFPGQGSQYPGMLDGYREIAAFSSALDELDSLSDAVFPQSLRECLCAARSTSQHGIGGHALQDTRVTQVSIGLVSAALARMLGTFGVQASRVAGHSYGELVALWYAGAMDDRTLLRLTECRGTLLAEAARRAPGHMAAVGADESRVAALLNDFPDVEMANLNTPMQTIIAGDSRSLDQVALRCAGEGLRIVRLNTAGAFHTSRMASALGGWRAFLAECVEGGRLNAPRSDATVIANVTAAAYPHRSAHAIAELLARQVTSRVRWIDTCTRLYDLGARVFVEIGPGNVLARTLDQNLRGRAYRALSCDPKGGDTSRHLANLLARLAVQGIDLGTHTARKADIQADLKGNIMLQSQIEEARIAGAVRAFFVENGKILDRYFGLAEKILDASTPVKQVPVQMLRDFLDQSAQVTSEYLRAHERGVQAIAAATNSTVGSCLPLGRPTPEHTAEALTAESGVAVSPAAIATATNSVPIAITELEQVSRAPSETELETWLRTAIAEVTGFPASSIERDGSFDQLGVDSLAFTELFARLTEFLPASRGKAQALFGAKSIGAVLDILREHHAMRDESTDHCTGQATSPEHWFRTQLAEITGFPASGIDLDATLDDLGIDSLARASLLETIIRRYPALHEYAAAIMQARTTNDVIAIVTASQAQAPGSDAPNATADPSAAHCMDETTADLPSTARWSAALLALRERIFAAIRAAGHDVPPTLTDDTTFDELGLSGFEREGLWRATALAISPYKLAGEALMATRTIGEALTLLAGLEHPTDARSVAPLPAYRPDALSRYVQVEKARPLPSSEASLPTGVLLIGSPDETFARFRDALRAAGIDVHSLLLGDDGWHSPECAHFALDEHEVLRQHLARMRRPGMTTPLIFLTPGEPCALTAGLEQWSARVDRNAVGLFCIAKALGASPDLLAAYGHLGVVLASGASPSDVAARGVARSLSHEWRDAGMNVSSLALDNAARTDPVEVVRILLANTGAHDLTVRGDLLYEMVAEPCDDMPLPEANLPLDGESVVLMFGGGVGIGAEVGIDLAHRYGCTIVALGRTAWQGVDPYPDAHDDAALAEAVLADMRTRAGASGTSMEMLHEALRQARRQRALTLTSSRVRNAGGRFDYLCADVTSENDVERAISHVRERLGHIDAVVHAAGCVEDGLITSKPVESFRRVLHTKAHSAFHLHRALRSAPPRFVAFFSSLVSHTGNTGQTDYCAANEVIDAIAHGWMHDDGNARVVSFLWSVWTETGLAGRGVQRLLERHALAGITSASGVRYFHAELARESGPDWVLITSPRTLEFMRGELAA